MASAGLSCERRRGVLDVVEWMGNKLPEPASLFVIAAAIVVVLSHVGYRAGWSVQPLRPQVARVVDGSGNPVLDDAGRPRMEAVRNTATGRPVLEAHGEPLRPVSLLTTEGMYWAISGMVQNFVTFPPLGIILAGILGVGVAERVGLISALLKAMMLFVPASLLTPTMVFLGINSSLASDAGNIVLPPVAAALYAAVGRSPLAGIAAVYAGVAAGFSANLLITPSDAVMAGFTETAARILDAGYAVSATCNWYFLVGSTVMLTLAGWGVTAWFVEPRFAGKAREDGGPAPPSEAALESQRLTAVERRGLLVSGLVYAAVLGVTLTAILLPGGPLHGTESDSGRIRWVQAIVPIIFVSFLIPGIVYGTSVGRIKREKDVTDLLVESMRDMAAVIVVYFFAAQFIRYFDYSNLGRMLSMCGGQWLAQAEISNSVLLIGFVIVVMGMNLLIASMSAKYAIMAPIFVPMLMMLGISPELTQAAYRIGDSCTNNIAPLNPYLVLILAVMQRYAPRAGMGTLLSMMTPYTFGFAIVWMVMMVVWVQLGFPLGVGGPLEYVPTSAG